MKLHAIRAIVFASVIYPLGLAAQTEATPPLVRLFEVSGDNGDLTREFYGRVAARETVALAFQVGGQIVELPIVEGQVIAAGSTIARLDTAPFEIARDQAEAQSDQATRTFERFDRLRGNAVSQASVDDARTQMELAGIALRDAERALNSATMVAPFEALVATRSVANFSTVAAGTPVVRLHDMSELHIEIDVPEVLFQRTDSNAQATVEAVFPGIDARFPLEIREFNAETSQAAQTFSITLAMQPPEDHVILPGSSVTVIATIGGAEHGVRIPRSSIVFAPDGTAQVMRYIPDTANPDEGTVSAIDVSITPSDVGDVLLIDGLSPGDLIVASGAGRLRDTDAVRRFTGFAN